MSIDAELLTSIDAELFTSIDMDARTWAKHISRPFEALKPHQNDFSGPLNALDIGAYDLGLGSFVSIHEGPDKEQNRGHQANQDRSSSIQKPDQTQEGNNDVPQSMDHYMELAQHGDQDVMNNSTEVRPSDRTNQTNQARIDPRTSRMEFQLEPRPDDRTDHTRACLSRPSRHSKDNSQARLSLGREEPKDGFAFSPGGPSGQSRVCPSPYRRAPIWFK
ncbi:hypothetical protein F2Q70_00017402 [Brassica cretica]|nr:hypothetical protein F2Q70_00017402 [Brassica cretica]